MQGDALLVIDLQNGVCHKNEIDVDHFEDLIVQVSNRIKSYADSSKPVIIVQHEDKELVKGSVQWQLVSKLKLTGKVYFIAKEHANSFFHTDLKKLLAQLNVQQIELCGAQTEYCIDATVKFAHGLGYKVLMCHGLTTTWDNQFMTAQQTISFYENIWNERFLQFID